MASVSSRVNQLIESLPLDFNQFKLDAKPASDQRLRFVWKLFEGFCEQLMEENLLTDMSHIHDIYEPTERKSLLAAAFEAQQKGSWKEFLQHRDAAEALLEHIHHHFYTTTQPPVTGKRNLNPPYGNFCTIVQSSGMGKSRVVDEIGRKYLVISMNLRGEGTRGFPPPDNSLREFLTLDAMRKTAMFYKTFLCALFRETLKYLKRFVGKETPTYTEIASVFRQRTMDHKSFKTAPGREAYFTRVIETAEQLERQNETLEPLDELQLLSDFLLDKQAPKEPMPAVFLAFDECHTLAATELCTGRSLYTELLSVLSKLREGSLFTLLLSTTGKISDYTPPPTYDLSGRIVARTYHVIPPFTDLGFDQMVDSKVNDNLTIHDVSQIRFWAKLGRPMFGSRFRFHRNCEIEILAFAIMKLLGGSTTVFGDDQQFACLSRRLPVDFDTSQLAYHQAQKQVEGHLRVCLQVDPVVEGMVTVAPSEPLVSEAAARLMRDKSYVRLLARILFSSRVNKGDCGEYIGMMLAIEARDHAVYNLQVSMSSTDVEMWDPKVAANKVIEVDESHKDIDFNFAHQPVDRTVYRNVSLYNLVFTAPCFLRKLFSIDFSNALPSRSHDLHKDQTLSSLLASAKMNFNHFIKVHESAAIGRANGRFALARGAGLMCTNTQSGVDAVVYYTYGDGYLQENNIGAILMQFKDDPSITVTDMDDFFDLMDPIRLGILSDETSNPIPIVRIVFSLASAKSSILLRENDHSESKFTSFDIFCSGVSHRIFRHVLKGDEALWRALVKASSPWRSIYTSEFSEASALRRAQNPLAATASDFYSAYFE
ncbi:hypothetical protein H0H87_003235 [Tephrocybe sp. NHM501043]|nr:hypothetical protein H0H87_003235 [Tephrocybe sp. NHM501043]